MKPAPASTASTKPKKKAAAAPVVLNEKQSNHQATMKVAPFDSLDRQKIGEAVAAVEQLEVILFLLILIFLPFIYSFLYRAPAAASTVLWSFRSHLMAPACVSLTAGACLALVARCMAVLDALSPCQSRPLSTPSQRFKGGATFSHIVCISLFSFFLCLF